MANPLRLVDANLNRAREGLRVLEDTVRFLSKKPAEYEAFRRLRHELDGATRKLYPELVKARDSQKDEGKASGLSRYRSVKAVTAANFKRSEEALRVLEEYARLFPGRAGVTFKKIRFELYILEKKLQGWLE